MEVAREAFVSSMESDGDGGAVSGLLVSVCDVGAWSLVFGLACLRTPPRGSAEFCDVSVMVCGCVVVPVVSVTTHGSLGAG